MILKRSDKIYKRTEVQKDTSRMYIFTDNSDRTSGSYDIPDDSEYSQRFGKKGLKYPKTTSAVLRGLDNAYPITTKKSLIGKTTQWKDSDFKEFKKVIDDDFEVIKKACIEKGYKEIIFPIKGILNSPLSQLSIARTPKLYAYIVDKEIELKNFNPEEK